MGGDCVRCGNIEHRPCAPQDPGGPFVAGVERGVIAMAVVEQIVRAISRMGDALDVLV
jgi:hypothetical protein